MVCSTPHSYKGFVSRLADEPPQGSAELSGIEVSAIEAAAAPAEKVDLTVPGLAEDVDVFTYNELQVSLVSDLLYESFSLQTKYSKDTLVSVLWPLNGQALDLYALKRLSVLHS